ncbi:outer dense fiber protein 4-like isoform X2 [Tupaia chinensis]|uniref:outer dense fiber protein 4-like isoform X2 n=1 Tax=Tupaia chinensis TaxID=246437 RepID=UPI0003C90163|nr:outer dense fiber protein 4-like isoform X2 [Tupaia chinensis]
MSLQLFSITPKTLYLLSTVARSVAKSLCQLSTIAGLVSKSLCQLSTVAGSVSKILCQLSTVAGSVSKHLLHLSVVALKVFKSLLQLSAAAGPEASIESIKSAFWDSKDNVKECVHSSQFNQSTPDDIHNFSLGNSIRTSSGWSQKYSRLSLLSINWWLLHEAKKISRQVSLVLNLSSLVLIGLISLGQPWIHFQVPLTSSWDPAGFQTIPITTILFVRCPDISCMHEYDQNAYLLDLSWAFLLFSSIASLCLCFGLIGTIFLTNFYLPMLDFFFFITSILAGTSIVLSILFYLLQAHEYLQEGMTYQLGRSFYLAWTGLLSYLNYMNFWSIWLTRSFGFRTKECVRRPASMALHQAPRDPTRPKSLL